MSKRLLLAPVMLIAICAGSAMADENPIDARTVGYGNNVKIAYETPSTATAWFALVGLGLLAIGPLFLNANRTHLD